MMKKIFTLLATGIKFDVLKKNRIHTAHSLWQEVLFALQHRYKFGHEDRIQSGLL